MKKKHFSDETPLKIYRLANQKDIETWQDVRKKEETVKVDARKISHALNLQMKITDVEFQGDNSKVTFYYTADNRVDFRLLIKEFAATFRTKIDMKQIGFRQEAAKIGGIGSCGRELCCSSWLTDFRSVNTNAARYQQLSINPQKLAGQCGKLKCCLNYELDSYLDTLSAFPPSSTNLDTERGRAFCIKIDVFKRKMWFAYADNSMAWYDFDIEDVKKMIAKNKNGEKVIPLEDLKVTENTYKTNDLIQESSLDRFEKDRKPNQNRNRNQKPDKRTNKPDQPKAAQGQRNNPPKARTAPENLTANPSGQNPPKKKFKKKFPPKKDNNA
jgi:cell fate regulator YaaT (PSP1 superfamily)